MLASNQTFWRNFDYFMSKLTTFNQSAVLCLCWPLSALPFFEYKYSVPERRWVCRRAKLPSCTGPLAHFHISVLKIVNIQSKNSSKCNVSKSTFWVSSISSSSKKCRLYDYQRSLAILFRTTDMYPSQCKTIKVKCYISKIPVNF